MVFHNSLFAVASGKSQVHGSIHAFADTAQARAEQVSHNPRLLQKRKCQILQQGAVGIPDTVLQKWLILLCPGIRFLYKYHYSAPFPAFSCRPYILSPPPSVWQG